MKRSPRPRKTPASLSESTHLRLNAYALAASAAGMGLLVLAQPAEAKIIYTPAHKNIGPSSNTPLDLNHDGIEDFSFRNVEHTSSSGNGRIGQLSVLPVQTGNRIWEHVVSGRAYASALVPGVRVGPKKPFLRRPGVMAATEVQGGQFFASSTSGVCKGQWANVSHRYLGVKFLIQGKTHFGWVRLNVSCPSYSGIVTATLTGFAYETVPNRPIITGRRKSEGITLIAQQNRSGMGTEAIPPATLGLLATGSPGLSIWRRGELLGDPNFVGGR